MIDKKNARSPDYKKSLDRIDKGGYCPLCWKNLAKEHKKPILLQTKHWVVTENQFSYKEARVKLLLIYKEHTNEFLELPEEAWLELRDIYKKIISKFKLRGSSFFSRQGDTKYTGGTVKHLHFHIITGDGKKEVLVRVG